MWIHNASLCTTLTMVRLLTPPPPPPWHFPQSPFCTKSMLILKANHLSFLAQHFFVCCALMKLVQCRWNQKTGSGLKLPILFRKSLESIRGLSKCPKKRKKFKKFKKKPIIPEIWSNGGKKKNQKSKAKKLSNQNAPLIFSNPRTIFQHQPGPNRWENFKEHPILRSG